MPINVNRITHVAAVVFIENFESTISRLSVALQIAFAGPYLREANDIRVAISWDAGIEVIAPATPGGAFDQGLKERGEGWRVVGFGVRDIDSTAARLKNIGIAELDRYSSISGVEPWVEHFEKLDGAFFDDPLFGIGGPLPILFTSMEPRRPD